jgi:two-component system, NarL family, sensor kinase
VRLVSRAPLSVSAAVVRFLLGSLLAMAIIAVGGFFALRSVAIREAERDTEQKVELQGALVEAAGLSDGILRGDPAARPPRRPRPGPDPQPVGGAREAVDAQR